MKPHSSSSAPPSAPPFRPLPLAALAARFVLAASDDTLHSAASAPALNRPRPSFRPNSTSASTAAA